MFTSLRVTLSYARVVVGFDFILDEANRLRAKPHRLWELAFRYSFVDCASGLASGLDHLRES
jgi:hypothetical protein